MIGIGAQEGTDVGGARQLVEATLLDGLQVNPTNAQALGDIFQLRPRASR
jgi:hypothetical protein